LALALALGAALAAAEGSGSGAGAAEGVPEGCGGVAAAGSLPHPMEIVAATATSAAVLARAAMATTLA
jgi:hypothetical protein